MKKILSVFCLCAFITLSFCSCNMGGEENTQSGNFDTAKEITVVSREEGSGLRGVVADLFDFLGDDDKDLTFSGVSIKESADDIRAAVSNNNYAIGYLPLTAVNDDVKTVKINGVAATRDNVKNGNYVFKHTVYAVTQDDAGTAATDFLNFLVSKTGRDILSDAGYITSDKDNAFTSTKPEGTLKISTAASAEPTISKLKDEYAKLNDKLKIEITKANSKASIESVKDKDCLAIITRDLTDSEDETLDETEICEDAIAVIVNHQNSLENITSDEVKKIYKGETTKWSEIIK